MSSLGVTETTPARLVKPNEGLIPTTELHLDGHMIDASISVPSDTATILAATDIAVPHRFADATYGFCKKTVFSRMAISQKLICIIELPTLGINYNSVNMLNTGTTLSKTKSNKSAPTKRKQTQSIAANYKKSLYCQANKNKKKFIDCHGESLNLLAASQHCTLRLYEKLDVEET